MKNIVISDEFKTGDFKPSALLGEYLKLSEAEVGQFFPEPSLKACSCPACGSSQSRMNFKKFNLTYHACAACSSWYLSPRPSDADIVRFYKTSKARQFWNEHLYPTTATRREEKIIKPRFQWIEDSTQEYLPGARSFVDFNANQSGYLAPIAQMKLFTRKTLVNPMIPLTQGQVPVGVQIMDSPWWQVQGNWDVVSLFEVLDHTSDIHGLLNKVHEVLNKGGLCFLTGILSSGFDLKVLGAHAAVFPPDRLNALSIEGIEQLARRHHFESLEISTPGLLDVQMVAKAKELDPSIELGDFVDYLLKRPQAQQEAFQDFLQANLLSSYGRILLRKI